MAPTCCGAVCPSVTGQPSLDLYGGLYMSSELLRVSDFCQRYAVSRTTFYRLVQRGELNLVKIGSATRVKRADAEAWIAKLER